jgi:hypothetical protein
MPESPMIAALAKQARDGLDAREERLRDGWYSGTHRDMLRTRAILGGWVESRQNGVDSRLNDLIVKAAFDHMMETFDRWQTGYAKAELADVAARRTLLDEALGWKHKRHKTSPYRSCIAETLLVDGRLRLRAEDETPDAPCNCGRDERVRAVLTALAAPYQEAGES